MVEIKVIEILILEIWISVVWKSVFFWKKLFFISFFVFLWVLGEKFDGVGKVDELGLFGDI